MRRLGVAQNAPDEGPKHLLRAFLLAARLKCQQIHCTRARKAIWLWHRELVRRSWLAV